MSGQGSRDADVGDLTAAPGAQDTWLSANPVKREMTAASRYPEMPGQIQSRAGRSA